MRIKPKHPPKLVFLVTEDHYFCSHRWDLAKDAMIRGYEVHVVCNVTHEGERIKQAGFSLHPLKHLHRTQIHPFRDLMFLWEVVRIFSKIKPQIVHNVAWKPTLYGSLAARITKVPIIVNMLGGLGFAFTARTPLACVARKAITFLGRRILLKTRCQIIVQNDDNRKVLLDDRLAEARQIHIIRGSGVDTEYFQPLPQEVETDPNQPLTFVCACRLIKEKGLDDLAAAMEILQRENMLQGKPFRMVLYGEVDEKYPNKISKEDLQLWQKRGWLVWQGFEKDMRKVYQECDAVVLPSHAEGMPKTLLEAASCGKAIIATDVSGCRDVVKNDDTGLLVPPHNPRLLADAIAELVHNSEMRQQMGIKGRLYMMQHFAKNIIHEQIFALYSESI